MSPRVAKQRPLRSSKVFRSLVSRLSEMAAREGITIRPFENEDLPVFVKLEEDRRIEVIAQLGDYVELCASFVKEGGRLRDGRGFAWRMLARLGWRPLCREWRELCWRP